MTRSGDMKSDGASQVAHDPTAESARRSESPAVPYVSRLLLDSMLAHPRRRPPWIEPVEGTLVMADVSGFTAMSERLAASGKEGAETLTNVINRFFTDMLDIACRYGGITLKFGGDAMLLIFVGPHDTARAAAAGLEMLAATKAHAAFKVGTGRVKLSMSMGAKRSSFYFAAVGDEATRMQEIILGPGACETCVAEAVASSGELCVDADTLAALEFPFGAEPRSNLWRITGIDLPVVLGCTESPGVSPSLARTLMAYLPPVIARGIAKGEAASDIEGEHRKVAVIFINLLGTEELLAAEGPDRLLAEVQRYTSRLVRLAERHDGFLVSNDIYDHGFKYILVFGAPIAHEWDTSNALRLACELQEEMRSEPSPLTHRIGVNSGFVFAGDVGPPYRRQYTVMGDAVNLAARLMSAAEGGTVLVSGAAAAERGGEFAFEELEPISVKGKSAPIAISRLGGHCAASSATCADEAAMLGRHTELRTVLDACTRAAGGSGCSLVVSGAPGIGKSRLVTEVRCHLEAEDWRVVQGACYAHTTTAPFTPWVGILEELTDLDPQDDPAARSERVRARVQGLGPDLAALGSLLNPLLGVDIPTDPLLNGLDDDTRRRLLFDVVVALLRDRASLGPVGVFVEDIHWADGSSVELLDYAIDRLQDSPVAFVLAQRPTDRPVVAPARASVEKIDLAELGAAVAEQVVREVLGKGDLPGGLLEIVIAKARGNPLFLQQLAQSLAQSGTLERLRSLPPDALDRELDALDIPDRVQGLVMSRLDRLEPREREVLRVASIIGIEFDAATVCTLLLGAQERDLVDRYLDALTLGSLLTKEGRGAGVRYRFSHGIIQEVAYESLLFARRRDLHHLLAEHIEEANTSNPEPVLEELAHHFRLSQDDSKTRTYSIQAAEKARRVFAYDEAIHYLRYALEATKTRDTEGACLRSYLVEVIGDCCEASGRHLDGVAYFKDALARWRRLDGRCRDEFGHVTGQDSANSDAREAVLCHKIGFSYYRTHCSFDTALAWYRRGLKRLPAEDRGLEARLTEAQSRVFFRKGELGCAVDLARRALVLARASGDTRSEACSHSILASAYSKLGDLPRSTREDRIALRLYVLIGDLYGEAGSHQNLASGLLEMGRTDEAVEHYLAALGTYERIRDDTELSIVHLNTGDVLRVRGDLTEAMDHLWQALESSERAGTEAIGGYTLLVMSRIQLEDNACVEALDTITRAIDKLRHAGANVELVEASLHEADVLLACGRTDEARQVVQSQLVIAQERGMKLCEAVAKRLLGEIATEAGDLDGAEEWLLAARKKATEVRADYDRGLVLLALARLYLTPRPGARTRPTKGILRDAERIFARVGAQRRLADVERMRALAEVQV